MILELCGLFMSFFLLTKWIKATAKDLPPGPWGLPLFGHLFSLGSQPYKTLMEWKEKYGPIIYCKFGSFSTVVLHDAKLIKKAFNLPEFSGRAEIRPFVEGCQKKGLIFTEGFHSTEQRQFSLRKLKDLGIGKKSIEPSIHEGVQELLDKIKASEGRAIISEQLTNGPVVSTLWSVLMTQKLSKENLEELTTISAEKINKLGSILAQIAFFMPWMDTFSQILTMGSTCVTKFKSDGFKNMYKFMGTQIAKRNETRIQDNPRDFVDALLDKVHDTKDPLSTFHEQNGVSRYLCGDLFLGGIGSTSLTLEWLFNYMARNPEIQKKLHEEIDFVVGSSRLPSLSDKPNMPYVDAVMYEILRFSSVFPFGLHHRTMTDVHFCGYRIPKNTMVLANLYSVHHDKGVWGDPESFRPERWLVRGQEGQEGQEGEEIKKLKGQHFLPFSVGRRSCPGEMLVRDQLFLFITTIFQNYAVSFPENKTPPLVVVEAVTRILAPFQLVFKAREII